MVPDTLGPTSYVQIRGSADAFGNWFSNAGPLLTNVDGDYWETTLNLKSGETIEYKFFTNATGVTGENEHKGWENDLTQGNRFLVVPNTDTILPLQFVNGTPNIQSQYYTPLIAGPDEVAVMFRVNMQGNQNFNKETQYVGVRGSSSAFNNWGKNFILKKESLHGNVVSRNYDAKNFWSGVAKIPKSEIGKTIKYKFVIMNAEDENEDVWGSNSNEQIEDRSFVLGGDTTLHWKWWEGKSATTPVIKINPNPLTFGGVQIDSYKDLPITIQNMGNANLKLTNLKITGENASSFSLLLDPESLGIEIVIAPSLSYSNGIRFKPDVAGYKTATLNIASDIGGSASIGLSGNATFPISVQEPDNVVSDGSAFLFQSNPNPVRSGYDASIKYRVNTANQINLTVYDVLGREIVELVNDYKSAGVYSVNFNTKGLPSGVYFYKLRAPGYEGFKKMVVVR
jgi:hypothetical protein